MKKSELVSEFDAFVAARLTGNELLAKRQLDILNKLLDKLPDDLTPHLVESQKPKSPTNNQ